MLDITTEAAVPLIRTTAGTPLLPEGSYPATLIAIRPKRLVTQYSEPPGQEQDFLEWHWLVEGGGDEAVELTSLSTLAMGPKSKVVEYLGALVGAEKASQTGAEFEETDLVGKQVLLKVIEKDGFAKVDGVFAPLRTSAKAEATPEPLPVPSGASAGATGDLPF